MRAVQLTGAPLKNADAWPLALSLLVQNPPDWSNLVELLFSILAERRKRAPAIRH